MQECVEATWVEGEGEEEDEDEDEEMDPDEEVKEVLQQ